jgi:glutaconate CoA-transferase subunit A
MYSMVQAGSMGVPFIAVRGLLGSDILKHRPDLKVEEKPFHPGEQVVVAQPLRPDVGLFHALKADRRGNCITAGLRDDWMMARAARKVIVTAEEIVDHDLSLQDSSNNTFLPAIDVDVVVKVPFGAHPSRCGTLYPVDEAHMKEYLAAAKEERSFREYLEKYVFTLDGHGEYLKRAGLAAIAA